jgi:hypothetical protein
MFAVVADAWQSSRNIFVSLPRLLKTHKIIRAAAECRPFFLNVKIDKTKKELLKVSKVPKVVVSRRAIFKKW